MWLNICFSFSLKYLAFLFLSKKLETLNLFCAYIAYIWKLVLSYFLHQYRRTFSQIFWKMAGAIWDKHSGSSLLIADKRLKLIINRECARGEHDIWTGCQLGEIVIHILSAQDWTSIHAESQYRQLVRNFKGNQNA